MSVKDVFPSPYGVAVIKFITLIATCSTPLPVSVPLRGNGN